MTAHVVAAMVSKSSDRAWWKSATVYQSTFRPAVERQNGLTSSLPRTCQSGHSCYRPSFRCNHQTERLIYQASFADHAANGHGTLRGILSKIPYLQKLGVDIVWLSPIYESPQADMGYDISDYRKIDPRYGTFEDWAAVRDACHERGMKLVMDLVVNHSSDQVSLGAQRDGGILIDPAPLVPRKSLVSGQSQTRLVYMA